MDRMRIAAVALAALLALPATALAQSAGDNQYQDPLAGQHQQTAPRRTPAATASPSPAAASAPSASPSAAAPTTQSAPVAQPAQVPLARTGFDAWMLALAGAVLVCAAVALRRSAAKHP